jgi:hypothetical protein
MMALRPRLHSVSFGWACHLLFQQVYYFAILVWAYLLHLLPEVRKW